MSGKVLDKEEIDALKESVTRGDLGADSGAHSSSDVVAFDLCASDIILREMAPTIETVSETLAGHVSSSLFSVVQRACVMEAVTPMQCSLREFLHSCSTPTFFQTFTCPELSCPGMVIIDSGLVYALADCFFGGIGSKPTSSDEREFSSAEMRIGEKSVAIMLEALSQSWKPIKALTFKSGRVETHPRFINIARPGESVVVCAFDVKIGQIDGRISWLITKNGLEFLHNSSDSFGVPSSLDKDPNIEKILRKKILTIDVDLRAELAKISMHFRDLINLKPGDIIPLEMPEKVKIYSDNELILSGSLGVHNGQKAFKVQDWLISQDQQDEE